MGSPIKGFRSTEKTGGREGYDITKAFEFVRGLEKAQEKLEAMVEGGNAKRALGLYEVFLSGCYSGHIGVKSRHSSFGY